MYGQPEVERPAELKRADEEFVRTAMKGFASRRAASNAWWLEGERFMEQWNFDFAMRRYNQSWLLDKQNYRPYWGFGRVLLQRDEFADSVAYFEKAASLVDNPRHKVALLTDMATAYSFEGEHAALYTARKDWDAPFRKANEHFKQASELQPENGNIYRRWAMALFREGRYEDAWERVKQARAHNAPAFPPKFLSALAKKFPEPR